MFWRTISILCCSISSYASATSENASQEWDVIFELPPGQTEDGIRLQAVYVFKASKPFFWTHLCSTLDIKVSLVYIENPPSDTNNYCTLPNPDVLMCRRPKHLSHDKSWLKHTLTDYLWSGVLSYDEMIVTCVIKRYEELKAKFPSLPIITTTTSTSTTPTTTTTSTTTTMSRNASAFPIANDSYIEQHNDGYGKHVRQREGSIIPFLFMVVPLLVVKILLLILLILTIQKLKAIVIRQGDQKPPHRSVEGNEKSRDSAERTAGTATVDLWNEPSKGSTTPSKESVSQVKSR